MSSTATAVEETKESTLVLKAPPAEPVNSRFGVLCTTDLTLDISMEMHKENRQRLLEYLRANCDLPAKTMVVMQGGESPTFFDTDHEPLFKQESNFQYLFGVKEPDFYGAIDVDTGRSMLFCPRLPEEYATWMGRILAPEEFKAMYEVDEVHYVDQMHDVLTTKTPSRLATLYGFNTDSGIPAKPATFTGIADFDAPTNDTTLFLALQECRVIKSEKELEVMRYMNQVTSEAHLAVMRNCAPGLAEYQMEAIFQHWCYYHGGSRCMSYTCICAAGNNGATLHYGHAGAPNDKKIEDGEMCLFDMGGEYHRYGSDVTCSFPANGKFTDAQKFIYETVLAATWAVEGELKEGVSWPDMHTLSYRVILTRLAAAGLVVGDVDDMLAADVAAVFMPHGLGHMLGLDTHDCGGYPTGSTRSDRPGYCSLRCVRVMKAGMIVTVEPGVYFNEYLLKKAYANPDQAKFLVKEAIDPFTGFGGVRIEDDVIVHKDHCEVMSHVPRTVADIEAVMAGTIFKREDLFKPTYGPGIKPAQVPDVTYTAAPTGATGGAGAGAGSDVSQPTVEAPPGDA